MKRAVEYTEEANTTESEKITLPTAVGIAQCIAHIRFPDETAVL